MSTQIEAFVKPGGITLGRERVSVARRLTLALTLPLVSRPQMDVVTTLGSCTLFRVEPAPSYAQNETSLLLYVSSCDSVVAT